MGVCDEGEIRRLTYWVQEQGTAVVPVVFIITSFLTLSGSQQGPDKGNLTRQIMIQHSL